MVSQAKHAQLINLGLCAASRLLASIKAHGFGFIEADDAQHDAWVRNVDNALKFFDRPLEVRPCAHAHARTHARTLSLSLTHTQTHTYKNTHTHHYPTSPPRQLWHEFPRNSMLGVPVTKETFSLSLSLSLSLKLLGEKQDESQSEQRQVCWLLGPKKATVLPGFARPPLLPFRPSPIHLFLPLSLSPSPFLSTSFSLPPSLSPALFISLLSMRSNF
jgi:hypothetical protein